MDYTSITAAVDFTNELAAMASIAAVVAGVLVARRGWSFIRRFI